MSNSGPVSKSESVSREATLHVRDNCLCLHAQRAARALARRFDTAFRPLEITNGQFSLMMALNRPAPPGNGEVAALLAMDRTTLTAALKPLERRGLVKVLPNPQDRRGRLLALTAKGRRLLARALPIWIDTHAAVEAEIGGKGPEALREGLRALSGLPAKTEPD